MFSIRIPETQIQHLLYIYFYHRSEEILQRHVQRGIEFTRKFVIAECSTLRFRLHNSASNSLVSIIHQLKPRRNFQSTSKSARRVKFARTEWTSPPRFRPTNISTRSGIRKRFPSSIGFRENCLFLESPVWTP